MAALPPIRPSNPVIPVALLALLLGACGSTGEEGKLALRDMSEEHDFSLRPLAVGRSASYEVRRNIPFAQPKDLLSAASSDERVLAVAGFSGERLTLSGVGPGQATLAVRIEGDIEDRFPLEVLEASDAAYAVKGDIAGLEREWARVRTDAKLRMPLSSSLNLDHVHFLSAQGRALSGTGGTLDWQPPEDGAVQVESRRDGYGLTLRSGTESGTVQVPGPFERALQVTTGPADPASFALQVRSTLGQVRVSGRTVEFEGASVAFVTLNLLDSEGFVHVGEFGLGGTLEISESIAGPIAVESGRCTEWSAGKKADDDDDGDGRSCLRYELEGFLRLSVIAPDKDLEGTLVARLGEATETFTLRFKAAPKE